MAQRKKLKAGVEEMLLGVKKSGGGYDDVLSALSTKLETLIKDNENLRRGLNKIDKEVKEIKNDLKKPGL